MRSKKIFCEERKEYKFEDEYNQWHEHFRSEKSTQSQLIFDKKEKKQNDKEIIEKSLNWFLKEFHFRLILLPFQMTINTLFQEV